MQLSKAKLGKYSLLRHKKFRDKDRLFIVQGEKAVRDTIGGFEVEALVVNQDAEYDFIVDKYNVFRAPANEIAKISTLENTPDIVAVYKMPERNSNLKVNPGEFSLVLDGIQDPGNLGTIIRTAHWFGIKNIFCSKDTVDIYNPKVVMATMGSISKVAVSYCNLDTLFDENPDVPVYGLLLEGENLFAARQLKPGFILMGSEGHGPKEETRKRITCGLTIPPANPADHPDSLNVAIAAAITLSQILK